MKKWQSKIAKLFGKDLKVQSRDMNTEGSSAVIMGSDVHFLALNL